MSAFYLMSNGKVASVDNGDGTTSLITLDKLKEYCGYQWRAVYEYDCDTLSWSEVSGESAWGRQSPIECEGTMTEITPCKYAVYGELYLCEPDPLPEKPTMGEFVPDCCVPDTCPCAGTWPPTAWPCGGLLESYSVDWDRVQTYYENFDCGDPVDSIQVYRIKGGPVTVTADSILSCRWESELVTIESRVWADDSWTDWEDSFTTKFVVYLGEEKWIGLSGAFGSGGNFAKLTGGDPVGEYTWWNLITDAPISPSCDGLSIITSSFEVS